MREWLIRSIMGATLALGACEDKRGVSFENARTDNDAGSESPLHADATAACEQVSRDFLSVILSFRAKQATRTEHISPPPTLETIDEYVAWGVRMAKWNDPDRTYFLRGVRDSCVDTRKRDALQVDPEDQQ